tara:strand:- start:4101 stop:4724 length:624 start_codon:yes stop_codon:yes gene_type:complete
MVYSNFILRLLFSILFITSYFIISSINFNLIFYLILIIYFAVILEIYIYFKIYKLFPIIYILISLIFFFTIDFNEDDLISFNIYIFIIIIFDIFSYIIGKIFGKNQLIKLSPNKTIEGFLGGFMISLILTILILLYLYHSLNLNKITFILIIILSAFAGDIIESYFKRKNNLKNSSNIIPGHGGVFDRFDSFLFSIILYSISIKFLL